MRPEALQEAVRLGKVLLVDARRSDLYNGWKDARLSVGGHVAGAANFDVHWLDVEKNDCDARLDDALTSKGMSADKNLVLCDSGGGEADRLGAWLRQLGFREFTSFDLRGWVGEGLPLERYPGYKLLVPAFVLKALLDGEEVETFAPGRPVKIVEASKGGEAVSYALGHVPGAVHLDVDHLYADKNLIPETRYRLADPGALQEAALRLGITSDDCVVVTGASPMAMCRAGWALHYLGVEDVRVLNGGWGAWVREGYPAETVLTVPTRAETFGLSVPGRREALVTIEEILELQKGWGDAQLVDIRSLDEYRGEVSGYDDQELSGHIPGAVLGYAGWGDPHSLEYYRNLDDTMRPSSEILTFWEKCGIDVKRRLIFSCGMGWRAAEVWFYARAMGLEKVSKYSDGWVRWSNSGYPIETDSP